MIEVKLSPEGTKAGAAPEELPGADRGDPRVPESPAHRPDDHAALESRSRNHAALISAAWRSWRGRIRLPKLSMGMSHDLEAAIEEGATHIRVGTALFGPRPKARHKT